MQHVKGYITFTGMHFVDASDFHTLIIGERDVWKHVKNLLISKIPPLLKRLLSPPLQKNRYNEEISEIMSSYLQY